MLLKKERKSLTIIALVFGMVFFVNCTKDNDPGQITDDTTVTDDDTGGNVDDVGSDLFTGEIDWIKTYGGSDVDQAIAVLEADDGNYIVAGSTRSTDGELVGRPANGSDYWLLKVSATDGAIIWNKYYGGAEDDIATNITKTSDGGYIISGYSQSSNSQCNNQSNAGFFDYWLVKIDSNGNQEWCQDFGYSGNDQAYDVFETQDGGFFATGYFDVTASGGEGNNDRAGSGNNHGVGEYWAIKMDNQGDFIWTRFFGGNHFDKCHDAIETEDHGFLLIGTSESLEEANSDITNPRGTFDYWVVKVDANGNKVWVKNYGGSEIDQAFAACETNDGNYFIVGDSRSGDQDLDSNYGNADAWLVKISPTGELLMEKNYGGDQFDSAKSIVPISDGNFLISGASRSATNDVSANNGENDAWVFVIDAQGTMLFEKSVGGSVLDFAEDAILSNGRIVVVGNTESNDGDIPMNKGIKDVLIIKIK